MLPLRVLLDPHILKISISRFFFIAMIILLCRVKYVNYNVVFSRNQHCYGWADKLLWNECPKPINESYMVFEMELS